MMVNATEMAKPFGYHKRPAQWLRTQHSQELINGLADIKKCTSADLVRVMKGKKINYAIQLGQIKK